MPQDVRRDALQFSPFADAREHLAYSDEVTVAAIGWKDPTSVSARALRLEHFSRSAAERSYLRAAFSIGEINAAGIQKPGAFDGQRLLSPKPAERNEANCGKAGWILALGRRLAHRPTQ